MENVTFSNIFFKGEMLKMELRLTGGLIGDIVGSRFEHDNCKRKDFEFFHADCCPTDDSIMTLAIADAAMNSIESGIDLSECAIESMRLYGSTYYDFGYGRRFLDWIFSDDPKPYESYGNGAAMRVSSIPYLAKSKDNMISMVKAVTEVTHNHPEALKGAEAVAMCIWEALRGSNKEMIRDIVCKDYYPIDFKIDEISDDYAFHVECQESVPQAIEAFLESNSFEDAIRTAVSLGGDSDTIACITGSIAGAYYGVPDWMAIKALWHLDEILLDIYLRFIYAIV